MNTRSSGRRDFEFYPEITRRDRVLRRQAREAARKQNQDHQSDSVELGSVAEEAHYQEEAMAAERTLRELANLQLPQQPLCINIPTLDNNNTFELKSGLIHLLPSFHGLAGEDPHKHLKEFHVVCCSMKPAGVTEEQIKLRAFPFSLKDAAKEWLYYLPSGSIRTWVEMETSFLQRYFPASRVANIRKEICGA